MQKRSCKKSKKRTTVKNLRKIPRFRQKARRPRLEVADGLPRDLLLMRRLVPGAARRNKQLELRALELSACARGKQ